jgi:hypothetical protein
MDQFASRPGAFPPSIPSGKVRSTTGQQRVPMPRETEEELTPRVCAELKRSLHGLGAVALMGLGLGYLLR